jgi:hypothetical protein
MGERPARAPQVVVIFWRDLPAQVNAQAGRHRHQVLLGDRFQRAIDRAKRKARIATADEDVAQWRRIATPSPDGASRDGASPDGASPDGASPDGLGAPDLPALAAERARAIDADYPDERLARIAFRAGWEHDP